MTYNEYKNQSILLGSNIQTTVKIMIMGNTLAATEFIRLLEASGSITANQSTGTRENTQSLGSNSRV